MHACSNALCTKEGQCLKICLNTLLGKVQIKTATTKKKLFSQSNAPYIFLYMIIKLREKGEMKGGKSLKGKTSTTGMNKLPFQASTWSPWPSLKQMAGARRVELRRYGQHFLRQATTMINCVFSLNQQEDYICPSFLTESVA